MEIFKEFYPAFAIGVIVGELIVGIGCGYILDKTEKAADELEASRNAERKACAELTEENKMLRLANEQIAKESFAEGIREGKLLTEVNR